MSKLIVKICKIDKVVKHPNADTLDIAYIGGWQVSSKHGNYQEGDKVIYIPPDSIVPETLSEKYEFTKYLASGGRVKSIKLRGEYSHGLILPNFLNGAEDDDVSEILGITKYYPSNNNIDCETPHPMFHTYTDIENIRNFNKILNANEELIITEKIHGSNSRIGMIENEVMVGSHHMRKKIPLCEDGTVDEEKCGGNIHLMPLNNKNIMRLIKDHNNLILFGEVYGRRSMGQNFNYGSNTVDFVAFDITINSRYLNYEEFKQLCSKYNIPTVPELGIINYSNLEEIKKFTKGKTALNGMNIREGVVIRPKIERSCPSIGRVILKYISDDFYIEWSGSTPPAAVEE